MPLFEILIFTYRESFTIFFHRFQVINKIIFMCWLMFCDKEGISGIFITMNESSIFFWHPNQFFKTVICNLQYAFELFGNGSWFFQNSLNVGGSGGIQHPELLTKALPWTHHGPYSPQHHFQVFKFWQLSPLYMLFSQYIRGVQIIHTCFACIQRRQLEKITFKLKDLPGTKLFSFWLHVTTCSLLYLQFPWTSLPTLQKQQT